MTGHKKTESNSYCLHCREELFPLSADTLIGTYERCVDEKSRVYIPRELRDVLFRNTKLCYARVDTKSTYELYPLNTLVTATQSSEFRECKIDKSGRITLPERFSKKSIVIKGRADRVSIEEKLTG